MEEGKYNDKIAFLIAELGTSRLAALACLPWVRLIELQSSGLSSEDERSAQIVAQALDAAAPPETSPTPGYGATLQRFGIDGTGVVIGICDTGVDTNDAGTLHRDLQGRLDFFVDVTEGHNLRDSIGHGTHVAGIALGNGASGASEPGPGCWARVSRPAPISGSSIRSTTRPARAFRRWTTTPRSWSGGVPM